MGMFSEANAKGNAEQLEKIILEAIQDPRWGDVRSAVMGFTRENLVRWYYQEVGETFGCHKAHPKIEEVFPPEKYI